MYKIIRSRWVKHLDFILCDLVCLQISFFVSYALRNGWGMPHSQYEYEYWGVILILLHICIVFFTECYSGIMRRGYLKEFKATLKYNCILLSVVFAFLFFTKQSYEYSRIMLFIFWAANCALMYMSHVLIKLNLQKAAKDGNHSEYLLLVTKKDLVEDNVAKIMMNEYSTLKLRGIVVVDENMVGQKVQGVPVVADLDNMFEFARKNVIDEILLNVRDARIEDLTNQFLDMGITVHINIDRISSKMPNASIEEINGFTVVTTSINTISTRQIVLKRTVDIMAGIAGMAAASLAYIIFAPIIYIQSPGPIFFSQVRVGRNGRRFKIYKFRSMYMDAEERKKELMAQNKMSGLMFKMDNDPRVIPIGRFLRSTSIDELPQFFNILKGDMSLVGTRPPTLEEYNQYELHHKSRLAAKPGLTGMRQVSGRSNITDFEEVVALDTEYIKNWSLGLDLKIIFKTALVVLGRVGSV
jgi:exopolysaccharide biosynthesis polyprenyl glycosylphosphotransferase